MRRRLLNLLTALSLLMCVGAAGLWVYSASTATSLYRQDDGVGRSILSDSGMIVYVRQGPFPDGGGFPWRLAHNRAGAWGGSHVYGGRGGPLGFGHWVQTWPLRPSDSDDGLTASIRVEETWVPWWWACAVFAALPAWRMLPALRQIARRQPPAGLCTRCGYDLRATPDRCPECGERNRAAVSNGTTARHSAL